MTKIKAILLGVILTSIIFIIQFYEFEYEIGFILLCIFYMTSSIILKGFIFVKTKTIESFSYKCKIISSLLGLFLLNITLPLFFYSVMDFGDLNLPTSLGKLKSVEIVSIIFIYPFLEEIFFRKIIAKGLNDKYGYKTAIWLSSFLFALTHSFVDTGFLISLLVGLILGAIYLRTNKIGYTIFAHMLINSLTLCLSKPIILTIYKIDNEIYFILFLIVTSLVLIGLLFLKKKKTWKIERN